MAAGTFLDEAIVRGALNLGPMPGTAGRLAGMSNETEASAALLTNSGEEPRSNCR